MIVEENVLSDSSREKESVGSRRDEDSLKRKPEDAGVATVVGHEEVRQCCTEPRAISSRTRSFSLSLSFSTLSLSVSPWTWVQPSWKTVREAFPSLDEDLSTAGGAGTAGKLARNGVIVGPGSTRNRRSHHGQRHHQEPLQEPACRCRKETTLGGIR